MATLQALLDQKAALETQIETMRTGQRAAAIDQIKKLMEENAVSLADLSARTSTPKAKSSNGAKSTGNKVPAKYRDKKTGDAWSGRGLKPKWLTAALADGKKIEDFAV